MNAGMPNDERGSLGPMPTLVHEPAPREFLELLEKRRRLGLDRRDEVREGVLHMIPPPSVEHERLAHRLHVLLDGAADLAGLTVTGTIGIGTKDDYCVPDVVVLRAGYQPQWNATAALVVEIVSPDDDTWEKLPFYGAHHVDEVVIVEPEKREVHWLSLAGEEYESVDRSGLLAGLGAAELARQLDWPE